MDVLVLAGSSGQTDLTLKERVKNKAFIKIKDKYIVSYVIECLQQTRTIERIVLVAPPLYLEKMSKEYNIEGAAEKETLLENILTGFYTLKPKRHFLVVTGDIPLLTPAAVEDFLGRCYPFRSDFYYPIITRDSCESAYPGVKRTFVVLKDGAFTGGNIFLINAELLEKVIPKLQMYFNYRKQPLKLASTFGWFYSIKFLMRRLIIADLERRFSNLLGLQAKAIISEFPEIGTDVDKLSDLDLVRRVMDSDENK